MSSLRLLSLPFLFVATVSAAGACYSYPDTSARLQDTIISTRYDPDANFATYRTYSIQPTVAKVSGALDAGSSSALDMATASALVAQVRKLMNAAGYHEVDVTASPDLGLELSVVSQLNVSTVYVPYYWYGYGWYYPSYWGYPGYGYYAPWAYTTTSWQTGTLVVDMFDLKAPRDMGGVPTFDAGVLPRPDGGQNASLPVVWNALVYGVLSGSQSYDSQRALSGLDQAFAQSPYLKQ